MTWDADSKKELIVALAVATTAVLIHFGPDLFSMRDRAWFGFERLVERVREVDVPAFDLFVAVAEVGPISQTDLAARLRISAELVAARAQRIDDLVERRVRASVIEVRVRPDVLKKLPLRSERRRAFLESLRR